MREFIAIEKIETMQFIKETYEHDDDLYLLRMFDSEQVCFEREFTNAAQYKAELKKIEESGRFIEFNSVR